MPFLVIVPTLQDDVSLVALAIVAVFNPAVVATGWAMGRRADHRSKLVVAGFAAALAGIALIWLATTLRVPGMATLARAAAGLFGAQVLTGLGWAYAGWASRGRRSQDGPSDI